MLNLCSGASPAATWYVNDDASADNNGSSWTDAFTDLQAAVIVAEASDQIWVAAGIYIPSVSVPGVTGTGAYLLVDGVELYGGFHGIPGSENDFDSRDFELYTTVLSGDLDSDDITNAQGVVTDVSNIIGQNSEHVVVSFADDSTTVVDGFTITAGHTDLPGSRGFGGGLYIVPVSLLKVSNCTFSGNLARRGGGIYAGDSTSPTLTNVTFTGNSAVGEVGLGGGMYASGAPTLINVTFHENTSTREGGGMACFATSAELTNVHFFGNRADLNGGGLRTVDGGAPTLTNVSFTGNTAFFGGGIYDRLGESTLTNVLFVGNQASAGGGMLNFTSTPTLTNVTFASNSAGAGGGMHNEQNSDPSIRNSIFWGNTAADGPQISRNNSTAHIADSLIQGGCIGGICTGTLLTDDPLFVTNPDDGGDGFGVGDNDDFGNLRLQEGSPAIDAGNNIDVPPNLTRDLALNPRIFDGVHDGTATVDMGAYEFRPITSVLQIR